MHPKRLLSLIDKNSLADYLWTLVKIPSPTLNEREAALVFAELLENQGAKVDIDQTIPTSPNIIGRLSGKRPGNTLQLAGHIDHIPVPHSDPRRTEDIISGRGSVDMKSGLAVILEILRVLKSVNCDFNGELLVTVYGLHEAPMGNSKGLMNLIERKVIGDSAIVFEGPRNEAIVTGKGQSIWNISIRREGEICHELNRRPEADNLLGAAITLSTALIRKNNEFSLEIDQFPLLGPESVFIGQLHYGDFYNRVPNECILQGTWRWHPDNSFSEVQKALHTLIEKISLPENISISETWNFVGESFAVSSEEAIVKALRNSYKMLTGKNIAISGFSGILDTSRIVPFGKIPAIPIGYGLEAAHSNYEYVLLDRLEEVCQLAFLTVLSYLSTNFSS